VFELRALHLHSRHSTAWTTQAAYDWVPMWGSQWKLIDLCRTSIFWWGAWKFLIFLVYWGLNSGPCTCTLHLSHAPSPFLPLVIFWDKVLLFSQICLDHDSPIYASPVAEMTRVYHHTQLLVEIGVFELLAWAVLEMWSSWSLPPKQLGL
jgi:hypothetical protein